MTAEPSRGGGALDPPDPGGGPRVLLVEDSPAIGDLVSFALEAAGYQVMLVLSVAEALAALAADRFDAVIADLRLPDGRGEEVVEAARARGERIAIVVTSGEEPDEAIAGVDALVTKPFTGDDLKVAILRALDHRRAAR